MALAVPPYSATSAAHPLIAHRAGEIVAYRQGVAVGTAEFLHDVARVAAALPERGHVLNLCGDRYRFAVLLLAAIARGQVTLLPPTTTANVIASLKAFAPDAYCVADGDAAYPDLPRVDPWGAADADPWHEPPAIPAHRVIACVFTSGSTGEPQPNFKTWGGMVTDARGEAARIGVKGAGDAILGTVPPQHMYGFESTVLLPLLSGAALTSERPYYPADIDAAIARAPGRRFLFITPFHLRAWLATQDPARVEKIVSATAPLSAQLAREAEARTGAEVLEIYGCTEAGQIATRRTALGEEWTLYDGMRLREQGGRAVVSGGHVEQPTPLQDVIEIRGDGRHFVLHGRLADMVNIAGKRNSLGYLNHQLASIPGVVDGIFHAPDEREADGVTRLMAFVVAPTLTAREVLAALRARLDPVFLPRPLVMVQALPRESTGKITRATLEALAAKARRDGGHA